jgi:hypothetical protein
MKSPEGKGRKKARALLARHGYRVGGHVTTAEAKNDAIRAVHQHERADHPSKPLTKIKLKRGGSAGGARPANRADKPSRRARGGANRKREGTKVIVVNGGGQQPPQRVPVPVPAGPPPGAAMPPPRPPMPPPGAAPGGMPPGMPPRPPMAKRGGTTERKRGGRSPRMTAGAKSAQGRLQKMKAYGQD